jgi:hypothetical protein
MQCPGRRLGRRAGPTQKAQFHLPFHVGMLENLAMSTVEKTIVGDLMPGDLEAAEKHVFEGSPFEAELAQRIAEHTERVSEEIFRARGLIDEATMQMLLERDQ